MKDQELQTPHELIPMVLISQVQQKQETECADGGDDYHQFRQKLPVCLPAVSILPVGVSSIEKNDSTFYSQLDGEDEPEEDEIIEVIL